MTETDKQSESYIIRGGSDGRSRLEVLHRALAPTTHEFLHQSGITPGQRGLDLGCGSGTVTLDLAKIVGTNGAVTGIDLDADNIAFARQTAAKLGLSQITYQQADVLSTEKMPNQQDFVYARFLLTHLADPASMIGKMFHLLKPGGLILLEDIDFAGHFCYPNCPAFDAYVALYIEAVRQKGADPNIGPRLPLMVKQAGFRNICLKVVQPVFRTEEGKKLASLTLENIADTLLRSKLVSRETLERYLNELRAFEKDENTLVSMPRIFQVWAAK